MIYRKALKQDIPALVALRIALLQEENTFEGVDIVQTLHHYFEEAMRDGLVVVVAQHQDEIIATSALLIQKYPPSFGNPQGLRAYITNVYTKPTYRKLGVSRKLMDLLIEEVKQNNIDYVWLWATKQGEIMYKKYGFSELKTFATLDLHL